MAFEGLASGVSGIQSSEKVLKQIGSNVSNVNSIAYKASRADCSEGFSNVLRYASASQGGTTAGSNTSVMQIGTGTQLDAISVNFSKGQAQITGRQTDLYIGGPGFLKVVDTVTGNQYATRQGNLRLDDRQFLVTQAGYRVQAFIKNVDALPTYEATVVDGQLRYNQVNPADPAAAGSITDIKIEKEYSTAAGTLVNNTGGAFTDDQVNASAPKVDTFSFDANGNITLAMTDGKSMVVGSILLMNFNDPQALIREGQGLYSNFGAAGLQDFNGTSSIPGTNGLGAIKSGALELSNVDLTEEFSNMIIAQRSFQASARVITTTDEVYGEVVNLKR